MSIDEFIRLFRRRLSKKKNNKDKRRASSVDIASRGLTPTSAGKKMSTSTVNLENTLMHPPTSVQIEYRRESQPQLLLQNMNPPSPVDVVKPFIRNPSKKKNLKPEHSSRSGFAQSATPVSTYAPTVWTRQDHVIEQAIEIESLQRTRPMDEMVWKRQSHKVYEVPKSTQTDHLHSTHFPVYIIDDNERYLHYHADKEREQLTSPTNESGYASGRVSGLELSMPQSQEHSAFSSPTSISNSMRRKNLLGAPKSMEALNDPKVYTVPIMLETSFDDNDITTQRIVKSDLLRQSQRDHIKSELQIRPAYRSKSVDTAVRYLQRRVRETKYITAVFESAKNGLAEMIDDVTTEFKLWLGEKSTLLGVAVEMHWSVPEKLRSRANEIRLKDGLHKELRQNNLRVLNLYEECRDHLPSSFIESKTEENCSRDRNVNAFQGVYRRYYPELLLLQDKKTVKSHSQYWTFENIHEATRAMPVPNPAKFLYHGPKEMLSERTIVALNLATIRLDDSE